MNSSFVFSMVVSLICTEKKKSVLAPSITILLKKNTAKMTNKKATKIANKKTKKSKFVLIKI